MNIHSEIDFTVFFTVITISYIGDGLTTPIWEAPSMFEMKNRDNVGLLAWTHCDNPAV